MEVVEIKKFLTDEDEHVILSIEEIKQRLDELSIDSICLDGCDTFLVNDDKVLKLLYNDYEHPIALKKDWALEKNVLCINSKWLFENYEACKDLFVYICSNVNKEEFSIGSSIIINDELIDALCLNKNLDVVSLAEFDDIPYSLTEEDYFKFKKSSISSVGTKKIDSKLNDVFDDLIEFNRNRNLISNYNYKDLQKTKKLFINKELTEEEILNLKYISLGISLCFCDDSYKSIGRVIDELIKNSKNNKLIIDVDVDKKEELNRFLLSNNIEYSNLYIKVDSSEYLIKDYLNFEKKLYDMVSGIEKLSPFEKYIYAYNVSKSFKKYKESPDDKSASRNLYSILINDYMVCVGFSKMLGDLLRKLSIVSDDLSASIEISYDNVRVDEEKFDEVKAVKYVGHARRYVHIVDEKYGIDGFYIADPTWDNDLENDCYNHLAMTNNEVLNSRRYLEMNTGDFSELFYINSIEEYMEKIKFLLERYNNKNNNLNKLIFELINFKLKRLDAGFVEDLIKKYSFIDEDMWKWPDDISNLVYDIGVYLVAHVNNEISGEVIMEAVSNVYRNAYGYDNEQLNSKMLEIINVNKKKQNILFPVRYNIMEDGTREVVNDVGNKFDIKYSSLIK